MILGLVKKKKKKIHFLLFTLNYMHMLIRLVYISLLEFLTALKCYFHFDCSFKFVTKIIFNLIVFQLLIILQLKDSDNLHYNKFIRAWFMIIRHFFSYASFLLSFLHSNVCTLNA